MALVYYRLPNTKELYRIEGKIQPLDYYFTDLSSVDGFVINSFDNTSFYLIQSDSVEIVSEENGIFGDIVIGTSNLHSSETDYLSQFETLHKGLQNGPVKKAILSRVKAFDNDLDPAITFRNILSNYPSAFCYLISSQETGTWMGATPEKLFNKKPDGEIQIHSLAGTQPANAVNWTDKEKEEQQLVTDYIVNSLEKSELGPFELGQTETILAGPVAHLRTTITLSEGAGTLDKLVKLLHPTPAVCGTPKEAAFSLIRSVEQHNRKFYTGFIGTLGKDLGDHLFVNLRCMELTATGADIYVGGGITERSNAEHEWQETELKSQTMLSVISS